MKIYVTIFAIIAVIMVCTSAHPPQSDTNRLEDVDSGIMINPETIIRRNRRFSCDLFSFESEILTPNHAACAARCITQNRRGGHCEGTTCICREDKIIESLP